MQVDTELEALGRIIRAVKTYRYQLRTHRAVATTVSMDDYLKKQLSIYDWILWKRLCSGQGATLRFEEIAYA